MKTRLEIDTWLVCIVRSKSYRNGKHMLACIDEIECYTLNSNNRNAMNLFSNKTKP